MKNKLDFGPDGKAFAYFKLTEKDGGTHLVWGLESDMGNNPVGRWMGLAMDSMIGPDYEEGLAKLKTVVEQAP